jgi:hypothetical protein
MLGVLKLKRQDLHNAVLYDFKITTTASFKILPVSTERMEHDGTVLYSAEVQ